MGRHCRRLLSCEGVRVCWGVTQTQASPVSADSAFYAHWLTSSTAPSPQQWGPQAGAAPAPHPSASSCTFTRKHFVGSCWDCLSLEVLHLPVTLVNPTRPSKFISTACFSVVPSLTSQTKIMVDNGELVWPHALVSLAHLCVLNTEFKNTLALGA
jgi:hypothetical protein